MNDELPFLYQCMNAFLAAFIMAGCLRMAVLHGLEEGKAICIGLTVLTYGYFYVHDRLSTTEGGVL